ncbi:MAG: hypothetical protein K6G60_09925 [Lachnospiraceae bacterium]|nr:hypothetical protein [Lachnospiraceae bacterium]
MNKKTFLTFVLITVFFTACGEKAAARDVMGENDGTLFGNSNETVSGDAASDVPTVTAERTVHLENEYGVFYISSIDDEKDFGKTMLFKEENGELKKILTFNGHKVYSFENDELLLSEAAEAFDKWTAVRRYYVNESGFFTFDKFARIVEANGLELKKDVTFFDDSGEAPKSASAGDIIIPVSFGQSCVGFESSNGEFLGYLYITEKDVFERN